MSLGHVSPNLDAIDAEIGAGLASSDTLPPANLDDQATRLRRLVEQTACDIAPPLPRQTSASFPQQPARTGLAKVIAVASGKGGVGKTNFAVNLAVAISQRRLKVILIDADLGTANADVVCGLNPAARLNHLVTALPVHDGARRQPSDILIDAPGGFRLLPGAAGVSRLADLGAAEQRNLLEVIGKLEREADVLIIDTAAGVGRSVTSLVEASDMGIVVTTPEPTSIADAYALIKCMVLAESGQWHAERASRLRLVVNQVGPEGEGSAVHARLRAVCERFLGVPIAMLGEIAQDLRVAQSVRARVPFLLRFPECPATRHMGVLAARIIDQLGLEQVSDAPAGHAGFRAALARVLLGRRS